MPRLRHTLEEARNLAELLADKLIASTSWGSSLQSLGASPATLDTQGNSSKHPTRWIVTCKPRLPQGSTVDGGEVFVSLDLESESATFRD